MHDFLIEFVTLGCFSLHDKRPVKLKKRQEVVESGSFQTLFVLLAIEIIYLYSSYSSVL